MKDYLDIGIVDDQINTRSFDLSYNNDSLEDYFFPAKDNTTWIPQNIHSIPPLEKEEYKNLSEIIQSNGPGTDEAVNRLVKGSMKYCFKLASDYEKKTGLEFLDLFQIAAVAVLKSARKYNYNLCNNFFGYARKAIINDFNDCIKKNKDRPAIYLDAPLDEEGNETYLDLIEDTEAINPERYFTEINSEALIDDLFSKIKDKDSFVKDLIKYRFGFITGKRMTYKEIRSIPKYSGFSEQRLGQIVNAAISELRKICYREDIDYMEM